MTARSPTGDGGLLSDGTIGQSDFVGDVVQYVDHAQQLVFMKEHPDGWTEIFSIAEDTRGGDKIKLTTIKKGIFNNIRGSNVSIPAEPLQKGRRKVLKSC